MDAVDRALVDALRTNGRMSYAELGRLVSLSGPSVTDPLLLLPQPASEYLIVSAGRRNTTFSPDVWLRSVRESAYASTSTSADKPRPSEWLPIGIVAG